MKTIQILTLALIAFAGSALHAAQFGSAFTYQGRLNNGDAAANGVFDFSFTLHDSPTNPNAIGGFVLLTAVPVTDGLFTVAVNANGEFRSAAFNGAERWLEIGLRTNGGGLVNFTLLSPRQAIGAVPYASFALNAGSANTVPSGAITSAMLANGAVTAASIASNSITAGQLAPGAAAANLGGSGGGLPATSIVFSEVEVNTNLLNAGFVPTGFQITNRLDAWTSIANGPPATGVLSHERANHAAVWVASFNAMFIFGGYPNRVGLRYHPGSNLWTSITESNAPILGENCVAAWTGSRLVVWDAKNRSGGQYNPTTSTWQAMSDTNAPSSRVGHVAVWTGSRLLLWGGSPNTWYDSFLNDGASYNPTTDTWLPITTNGALSARGLAAAVWSGTEMIVQGGISRYESPPFYTYVSGDVGRYNPTTGVWTPGLTGAVRFGHAAVWTGSRMIVVGGTEQYATLGDFTTYYQTNGFSYNPANNSWAPIADHVVMTNLTSHSAVWSGTHLFVWGGISNPNGARYTPATDTWTILPATGVGGRFDSSAVWTGTDLIGWGGVLRSTGDATDDGRRYNLAANAWTALPIPPATGEPSERTATTAVWAGDRLIVWGGTKDGVDFRTGGIYRPGIGWTNTPITGAPSGRSGHSAVWTGSEMIVWGGADGFPVNTGARFNLASNKWFAMNLTNAPTPRRNHSAVWTGSEMIVWGGYQQTNSLTAAFLNTGGRYNPATDAWDTNFPVNPIVGGRANHTAVWTGTEMLIWGGYSKSGPIFFPTFTYFGTGARYTPGNNSLSLLPLAPAGNQRTDHTAVWTGREMLIWGGVNSNGETNSGLRFNPASNAWAAMPTNNVPAARSAHTAVWTGEFMIISGGYNDPAPLKTTALFDPLTDKWSAAPNAPIERQHGVAVWTGSEMLTGNGQLAVLPLAFWASFSPRQIYYFYQKP